MINSLMKKLGLFVMAFAFTFASVTTVEMCLGESVAVAGDHESGFVTSDGADTTSQSSADYTEFDGIWNRVVAWTEGSLGRVVAGAFVLVGIIAGVARQSLMAFAVGISAALGLVYAPSIIKSVFTADIDVNTTADVLNSAFEQLSNKMQR